MDIHTYKTGLRADKEVGGDTLGGPMGPWDRWDLGTDWTWASRTPDHNV